MVVSRSVFFFDEAEDVVSFSLSSFLEMSLLLSSCLSLDLDPDLLFLSFLFLLLLLLLLRLSLSLLLDFSGDNDFLLLDLLLFLLSRVLDLLLCLLSGLLDPFFWIFFLSFSWSLSEESCLLLVGPSLLSLSSDLDLPLLPPLSLSESAEDSLILNFSF